MIKNLGNVLIVAKRGATIALTASEIGYKKDCYNMVKYWCGFCPVCGMEGQMFVVVRADTGNLFLECDECCAACDSPDVIDDEKKGYSAVRIEGRYATRQEIEKAGWFEKYEIQESA